MKENTLMAELFGIQKSLTGIHEELMSLFGEAPMIAPPLVQDAVEQIVAQLSSVEVAEVPKQSVQTEEISSEANAQLRDLVRSGCNYIQDYGPDQFIALLEGRVAEKGWVMPEVQLRFGQDARKDGIDLVRSNRAAPGDQAVFLPELFFRTEADEIRSVLAILDPAARKAIRPALGAIYQLKSRQLEAIGAQLVGKHIARCATKK